MTIDSMDSVTTRVDLHLHSKFSIRPSQWILQKIGCPESFVDPVALYELARQKDMSLVTITDHNTIAGCLEIAHLPGTFISEEVTSYFPEDRCKAHVLVHGIDEEIHGEIQKVRESVYDLVSYLSGKDIYHALAHPLFGVNDKLTMDHFEKMLLLFRNFELNGSRSLLQNQCLRLILSNLGPETIERLTEKHGIEPHFAEPWKKILVGGSDDHSALNVANIHTEVPGLHDAGSFLAELRHRPRVVGEGSDPKAFARNIYAIAYQFYKQKLGLEQYSGRDDLLRVLDRFLKPGKVEEPGMLSRLHSFWSRRRHHRTWSGGSASLQDLFRHEALESIWDCPELLEFKQGGHVEPQDLARKWFEFVNQVSNKVLLHFADHLLDHLAGANVFSIFHSFGSAGGLYTLLAPYFVAYSMFSRQKAFSRGAVEWFAGKEQQNPQPCRLKIAHFTDTFYEVNGVATTLQQQINMAIKARKDLVIITCDQKDRSRLPGVRNFNPVGLHELPEYPEQKLCYPPFLEMLSYCYEQEFTHIHAATPGPIGLAALAIARILGLPIYGTYHTALPQYAQYLTNDPAIEEITWRYTLWYYDQMDEVFVPSRSTGDELAQKGIAPGKIHVSARGIDIQRFHPSKRSRFLETRFHLDDGAVRLLYVGRISKEKDLPVLEEAFRLLVNAVGSRVHLVLVGDGPYLDEMRENLSDLPCTFTGYLEGEELATVYASCNLFVFPSTTDTFGNVVLEAQASGLPVVVTDSGGPQENLLPGKTGVVVKGNSVLPLYEALRTLVQDPRRLEEMGRSARLYTEGRTFEKAFHASWQMYRILPEGGKIILDRAS